MRKNWALRKKDSGLQKELSSLLNISPVTSQILINRGIKDSGSARIFLEPKLQDLHNPFLMKSMREAVERVRKAAASKEKILVCGDYDADGLTATALLLLVFEKIGVRADYFVPNRLEDGYGLSPKVIEICRQENISLLITVDCGISAHDVVGKLAQQGVDVIITDHHQPTSGSLPNAHSIVCPLQEGCSYPYKDLAGVGIAFKLAQGLAGKESFEHLDLVCLGTISDVVSLTGENRILVKAGLEALAHTKKKGLQALIDATKISKRFIGTRSVAYILGPRINAQGRLGSCERALKLFLTKSSQEAEFLAKTMHEDNRSRQSIEAEVLKEALSKVDREIDFSKDKALVLCGDGWHPGVIGIVASRLVDRFYRPAIVIATQNDSGKGSGRSIRNFDLFEALSCCSKNLEGFGGHESACGITIKKDRIEDFRREFNEFASRSLSAADLVPSIDIDAEISLEEMSASFMSELADLEPFGEANPKPILLIRNFNTRARQGIVSFDPEYEDYFSALQEMDLVFTPETENWLGQKVLSLKFVDGRKCARGDLFS